MDLQVGDVVVLRSGGPKMTINKLGDYGLSGGPREAAKCVWFSENKLEEALFDLKSLEKSE